MRTGPVRRFSCRLKSNSAVDCLLKLSLPRRLSRRCPAEKCVTTAHVSVVGMSAVCCSRSGTIVSVSYSFDTDSTVLYIPTSQRVLGKRKVKVVDRRRRSLCACSCPMLHAATGRFVVRREYIGQRQKPVRLTLNDVRASIAPRSISVSDRLRGTDARHTRRRRRMPT